MVNLLPGINNGPALVDPYMTLRNQIIKKFTPSSFQRMEMLHNLPPMGDKRPSELWAQISNLESPDFPNSEYGRHAWLSRLLEHIRAQLGGRTDNMDVLSERADEIHRDNPSVFNIEVEEDTVEPCSC